MQFTLIHSEVFCDTFFNGRLLSILNWDSQVCVFLTVSGAGLCCAFRVPLMSDFSLQVTYAARDAQVSVALFLHLLGCSVSRSSTAEESHDHTGWREVLEKCRHMVDVPFRSKAFSRLGEEVNGEATESPQKPRNKKAKNDGAVPGSQQGRDPRRHKRKPLGVGYSAR